MTIIQSAFENTYIFVANDYNEAKEIMIAIEFNAIFIDSNFNHEETKLFTQKIKKESTLNVKVLLFIDNVTFFHKSQLNLNEFDGFVDKSSSEKSLTRIINLLFKNIDKKKYRIIDKKILKPKLDIKSIRKLSNREYEVAIMLSKGYKTDEISNMSYLKKTTISTYKRRIYEKLSITNIISLSKLITN